MPATEPCGFTYTDPNPLLCHRCDEVGDHFCRARADHAQAFFEELLLHTKGAFYRKPFVLTDWQRDDIVRPLFGETVWSEEFGWYKRRYEVAWIEIARKNGKSELLAGIMLYLLVADGERSAELYGVAKNRDQAALVFDVAAQMVILNPVLAKRLNIIGSKRRIVDKKTNSFYRVIAADAGGALGSNPHGVGADEILAWPNGDVWDAMRTGMGSGARRQALMVAATTAGNNSEGFAGQMHRDMEAVLTDPDAESNRHIFVFMRNTPMDADPWDESNWEYANPALASGFLSWEGMRKQASDAKRNPVQENSFRQFKLNQWVSQSVRWMPMHDFDAESNRGEVYATAQEARAAFNGREAWFGLDLAARQDLCAWALLFPDDDGNLDLLWRFWMPEAGYERFNQQHNGRLNQWVRDGWLTVTDGDVLDFDRFYDDVEADALRYTILGGDCDKFAIDPVVQELLRRTNLDDDAIFAYNNTYSHMSNGMGETLNAVKRNGYRWHGNPVARFCFEGCEAVISRDDPDLVKPGKVKRQESSRRIDGVAAAVMAMNAYLTRGDGARSIYEERDLIIL
ncbi:terminase TerL endonuclease subunit [Gordonia sp. N1V]|uniref:terminase large subunit n=1 Tax=Gordonia sp. N1V TaxID=3034163 RepID=UPI0023E24C66|nr:terminase TerL endonuclease subunit [Gordonia sp. N1V]MDF3280913.1 terminase large subunit [Gordonia sp. N1V]